MNSELNNKNIGADLCKLAALLHNSPFCVDVSPLNNAGQSCITKSNASTWTYKLEKIVFKIDSVGGRLPADSGDISVSLSIDIAGKNIRTADIFNPITNLNFDLEIDGFRYNQADELENLFACWHLDRHLEEEKDGKPYYSHPLYHFAFGGNKMEAKGEIFGNTIILPAPRFAYPPMDAILGIDFILQNYVSREKIGKLIKKPEYIQIVKNSQERLWKPFFYSLYSHWDSSYSNIMPDFSSFKLLPLYY